MMKENTVERMGHNKRVEAGKRAGHENKIRVDHNNFSFLAIFGWCFCAVLLRELAV